jgi:cytochrome P450
VTLPAEATGLPPGPPTSTIAASVHFKRDPVGLLDRCREEFGDRFTLPLLPHGKCVILGDPADVRLVFARSSDEVRAGEANGFFAPVTGERSMFLLDGPDHLEARRRVLPAFRGSRTRAQAAVIARLTAEAVDGWPRHTPFRTLEALQALTLDVLLSVVLGVDDAMAHEELVAAVKDLLKTANPPGGALTRDAADVRLRTEALVREELARRRRERPEGEDVVAMLLFSEEPEQDTVGILLTLLVAGYETSATTLSWALERLARHPDDMARVTAEATGGAEGDAAEIDAVVHETLRVRPIVPLVGRRLHAPLELTGGLVLPAGVTVAPSVWLVNTREATYPDARAFRPQRFLGTVPDTYAWLPFGGGVRRCLGATFALMEMRVMLREIARRVIPRPARVGDEPIVAHSLSLVPGDGGLVIFEDAR